MNAPVVHNTLPVLWKPPKAAPSRFLLGITGRLSVAFIAVATLAAAANLIAEHGVLMVRTERAAPSVVVVKAPVVVPPPVEMAAPLPTAAPLAPTVISSEALLA